MLAIRTAGLGMQLNYGRTSQLNSIAVEPFRRFEFRTLPQDKIRGKIR
jgi:hypothetical protein